MIEISSNLSHLSIRKIFPRPLGVIIIEDDEVYYISSYKLKTMNSFVSMIYQTFLGTFVTSKIKTLINNATEWNI